MSLRYGNIIGLFQAGICSILYIISYTLLDKDLFLLLIDFNNYKFLLMFFGTAILLGLVRDRYEQRIADLLVENKKLSDESGQIKKNYDKIQLAKEELKKQIIGAEDSILSLYDVASSLESMESEEIFSEVMGILVKFLKAKTVSIYTINKYQSYFRLKVRFGDKKLLPNSIEIKSDPFFDKIKTSKVAQKPEPSDPNLPIFSAPLVHEGELIGVMNMEEADFTIVTDYTFNLFKIITEWTAKSLTRALLYEHQMRPEKYFQKTAILRIDFFKKRLAHEQTRFSKYGIPFLHLTYKSPIKNVEQIQEKIKTAVREGDVLGYEEKKSILHVLLPVCPENLKPLIEGRIMDAFDKKLKPI